MCRYKTLNCSEHTETERKHKASFHIKWSRIQAAVRLLNAVYL